MINFQVINVHHDLFDNCSIQKLMAEVMRVMTLGIDS